jgi:hypothetical protein
MESHKPGDLPSFVYLFNGLGEKGWQVSSEPRYFISTNFLAVFPCSISPELSFWEKVMF